MLNQTQFGAPQGSGLDLSPLSEAMNKFFAARKKDSGDLQRMAGQYALDTMRDTRKHEQTKELEGMRQAHAVGMQERGLAHAAKEGRATRRHEKGMKKLDIAGHVLKTNTAFEGITALGKGKRVSNFSMDGNGGMNVTFNKPTTRRRSSATPGQPTVVEPTAPTRAAETPAVPNAETPFTPKIRKNPTTGRIERITDSAAAPAPTAKAASKAKKSTPAPSVRRNPKTGRAEKIR